MKRGNNPLVLCLFGILPVVWLGLLIAPAAGGGLPEILARFPAAMNDPFKIELCGDSLKTVLVLLCVYGLAIGVYLSSRRNYRRGEEHGSAKWGNARAVNKKYQAANPEENKILTQNVRMGFFFVLVVVLVFFLDSIFVVSITLDSVFVSAFVGSTDFSAVTNSDLGSDFFIILPLVKVDTFFNFLGISSFPKDPDINFNLPDFIERLN